MARKSPTTLPPGKFLGKYVSLMEKAHAAEQRRRFGNLMALLELLDKEYKPPPMTMSGGFWKEVEQWWPFVVLRQAAEDGDSEGCKRLLYSFLSELNVQLPKDVLIPFRWKHGRPSETEAIYEAWIARGRPTTTWKVCDELAKIFYAGDFAKAKSDPKLRKNLRDRIRATLLRHRLIATKSIPIS
jgi:hypothetical protein